MTNLKAQLKKLESMESPFEVRYPEIDRATYTSKVNYKSGLQEPFQNWFNYKEGYSLSLNFQIFEKHGLLGKKDVLILDPFAGSGTTLLAAKQKGFKSIGFDVNPYSILYAGVKTQNYSEQDLLDLKDAICKIERLRPKKVNLPMKLPALKMADKVFDSEVLKGFRRVFDFVKTISNPKIQEVVHFSVIANFEALSKYRKAGNGLKKRKTVTSERFEDVPLFVVNTLSKIQHDVTNYSSVGPEPVLRMESATILSGVKRNSVDGVIFSPPYANCFDYFEIYKIELWFGGFVKSREDLAQLRQDSLSSHLNRKFQKGEYPIEVNPFVKKLREIDLWDKRIPSMVGEYFGDMEKALGRVYDSLKPGGFCCIVVSNSIYGGILVPTDLLLAQIAARIGFEIEFLEVARWVIPSSQQYTKTLPLHKFIRETLIHVRKPR
jgi:SAM-dependent methyltransferase